MSDREATEREVRAHYKAQGYEVRIRSWGEVEFRRDRDRFPGSPQIWLSAGQVGSHCFNPERGVYYP